MLAKQLIMPLKYCRLDPVNFTDFEVSELTQDTRKVRPGAVFVAIKGSRIDGIDLSVKQLQREHG